MPNITVTVAMQNQQALPPAATFVWTARLEYESPQGRRITHPTIAPHTSTNPSWRIPFTHIRGGTLTVQVEMSAAGIVEKASKKWFIGGSNPTSSAVIRTFVNNLPAPYPVPAGAPARSAQFRQRFRQIIRQESQVGKVAMPRQFLAIGRPIVSNDGGVGLCQITGGDPAPTDDQYWNWQENIREGWRRYQQKERMARDYLSTGSSNGNNEFRNLVADWNRRTRPRLQPLPVVLPPYTAEMLERDTIRGYNGFSRQMHEYRPARGADGILDVTVASDGRRKAKWEPVPVTDRSSAGEPDYVNRVLGQPDL